MGVALPGRQKWFRKAFPIRARYDFGLAECQNSLLHFRKPVRKWYTGHTANPPGGTQCMISFRNSYINWECDTLVVGSAGGGMLDFWFLVRETYLSLVGCTSKKYVRAAATRWTFLQMSNVAKPRVCLHTARWNQETGLVFVLHGNMMFRPLPLPLLDWLRWSISVGGVLAIYLLFCREQKASVLLMRSFLWRKI